MEPEPVEFTMAHPIEDDYTGPPRSLFAVVCYGGMSPCSISILKLETQGNSHEPAAYMTPIQSSKLRRPFFSSFETQLNQKEYVTHFRRPQGPANVKWLFSLLTSSTFTSTKGLCMVPYWDRDDVILNGYKFNFETKTCESIEHPKANKSAGYAVNMRGCIYYLAQPYLCIDKPPDPSFERYDPVNDKWESLQPFPHDAAVRLNSRGYVVATAVWNNTILFSMGRCQFWAYYSPKNRWYRVDKKDNECYNLVGETVVVENTIYALSHPNFDEVMALSIKRTGTDDFAFECSLRSEIQVPDMDTLSFKGAYQKTGHLVHLGKDNFCIVRSCQFRGCVDDFPQPILVTSIKLKEEESMISMTVTGQRQHLMQIVDMLNQFHVVYCFSVPERNTIALNQGKSFIFHLNPFPEDFDPTRKHINVSNDEAISLPSAKSNVALKASTTLGDGVASGRSVTDEIPLPHSFHATLGDGAAFGRIVAYAEAIPVPYSVCATLGDGAASRRSNTVEKVEGYSIYVTNCPVDITFCELEMELKKRFGPIKRDGMEVILYEKRKPCAIVEFISPIEASPIMFNGCRVLIKEKE